MKLSTPYPQPMLRNGSVVSICPIASAVGSRVLREGGNAVDAAVATGLALAVTFPQAGNLGGGGLLLARSPSGDTRCLDYRETAPRNMTPSILAAGARDGEATVNGALSVCVPGSVAGLYEALKTLGTWSWDRVLSGAIDLAEKGFWLSTRQADYFSTYEAQLSRHESSRKCFLPGGRPPPPATLFQQPDLASTLRTLAEDGPQAFYRGSIAERLVREVQRENGAIDLEDLAAYSARWRTPLQRTFFGRKVLSPSLPSGGAIVLHLALGLLESSGAHRLPAFSVERAELLARVFRVAFALRAELAGDPDYLDDDALARVHAYCEQDWASGGLEYLEAQLFPLETERAAAVAHTMGPSTTHYCVIDPEGGAASVTTSLNTTFGSKLVADGLGFLLNNSLDDFHIPGVGNWYGLEGGGKNELAPGRRPASSMAPTIVVSDEDVELLVGAAGGPRIPTAVAQIMLGVLAEDLPIDAAMHRPRIHHQCLPDLTLVEKTAPAALSASLKAGGRSIQMADALGLAAAIHRNVDTDEVTPALDRRALSVFQ